jgi:thioredoxin-dependent peroxiredoxin
MQDYFEPKPGDMAPNFSLSSTEGREITLQEFKGKDVILYFYPKDDTPGCTTEACSFRDSLDDLQKEGAVILGVSTDSIESHRKFREKHNLNFALLSDETADVPKMFGAWKEKNLYGRRSWGVARMTYWIGGDGRVKKVYKKVDPAEHAAQILDDLRGAKGKK